MVPQLVILFGMSIPEVVRDPQTLIIYSKENVNKKIEMELSVGTNGCKPSFFGEIVTTESPDWLVWTSSHICRDHQLHGELLRPLSSSRHTHHLQSPERPISSPTLRSFAVSLLPHTPQRQVDDLQPSHNPISHHQGSGLAHRNHKSPSTHQPNQIIRRYCHRLRFAIIPTSRSACESNP